MGTWSRLGALALGAVCALPLRAVGGSATDGAVTLRYTDDHWGASPFASLTGTEPGAPVSPASVLYQAGWWYRAQGDDREHPLPPPDTQTYTDGRVVATWDNIDGTAFSALEVTTVFDDEGPSGAIWSDLWVTNNNDATFTFSVFHFADFDVAATAGNDSGQLVTPHLLRFTDGAAVMRYKADAADHFSVKFAPLIRDMLNDATVSDLDDAGLPFGPGDVQAAFERTAVLPPGGVFVMGVGLSSRLASDHVRGAFLGLTPNPSLLTHELGSGTDLTTAFRRTSTVFTNGAILTAPGFQVVARDDFDGDFDDETLTRNLTTGETRIRDSILTGAPSPAPNWTLASTGDFNADGKADILWRNQTSGQLSVWLMNGRTRTAALLPSPDHAADANWAVAGSADFNADGARDILWYNQTSGNIVIWYMDAALQRITGAFTNPASVGNNNWRVVAVGDYGRGAGGQWNTADVVWQNDTSRRIVVWHMDTAGNRTAGTFTSPDNLGADAIVTGPR